jgi:hypothetical protein
VDFSRRGIAGFPRGEDVKATLAAEADGEEPVQPRVLVSSEMSDGRLANPIKLPEEAKHLAGLLLIEALIGHPSLR